MDGVVATGVVIHCGRVNPGKGVERHQVVPARMSGRGDQLHVASGSLQVGEGAGGPRLPVKQTVRVRGRHAAAAAPALGGEMVSGMLTEVSRGQ